MKDTFNIIDLNIILDIAVVMSNLELDSLWNMIDSHQINEKNDFWQSGLIKLYKSNGMLESFWLSGIVYQN